MESLYCPLNTINQLNYCIGSFESKGSKFICYIFPFHFMETKNTTESNDSSTFQNTQKNIIIKTLQDGHKKARHFVWAFRIFNEYHHIIEGSNDDGEPKGSSGPPMLEVMRGEKIINAFCVCVRYFGGTKLGVGGLVRAYTHATLECIKNAHANKQLAMYKKLSTATIHEKSTEYNKIFYLTQKYNLTIIHKNFMQANMSLQIQGQEEDIANFLQQYTGKSS